MFQIYDNVRWEYGGHTHRGIVVESTWKDGMVLVLPDDSKRAGWISADRLTKE